jgi:hypothetical protein
MSRAVGVAPLLLASVSKICITPLSAVLYFGSEMLGLNFDSYLILTLYGETI